MSSDVGATVSVETTGVESGGGAVGRLPDGRAVFVRGALPAERVVATITELADRYAFATIDEVVVAAPGRIAAPCPAVAAGCGGCNLQHATVELQREMKVRIITDALARIGRLPTHPEVRVVGLAAQGFRTTVRAAVDDAGRPGFRHARGHDVVAAHHCLVAHPLAARIVGGATFPGADEVTIRIGARTGEALVIVDPGVGRVHLPADVDADSLVMVGSGDAASTHYHEEIAGRRWRISGASFFQSRPDGAEALVAEVRAAVEELVGRPRRLVDLCAGVGLFAGSVDAERVVAVESNRAAVADARANLKDLGDHVRVVTAPIERWRASRADVVIADPPRVGLRRVGVEAVAATGASLVVLVSCDAGSFGRDAGLLVKAGFRLDRVTLVDMFPHTHHVEVVAAFVADQAST